MKVDWTSERLNRYARQVNLTGFDLEGQERLYAAHVLVIGAGGLGCAAAQYLASTGVGTISLVDPDSIEASNLHRQILYRSDDIGRPKVEVAARVLQTMNPDIRVHTYQTRFEAAWFEQYGEKVDVVVDATDNRQSREIIHQQCRQRLIPLIMGAAIRLEGQISVFTHQAGAPCFACLTQLFGETELSCVEAGVMPAVVGTIGSLQALEAVKLILGWPTMSAGELLLFDGRTSEFRVLKIARMPHCPVCGHEIDS